MIEINKLTAWYDTKNVLHDLSLKLDKGASYVLIGPSGCGKSTLIRILCGIHRNYTGTILHEGKPISYNEISIGYVPQAYGLLNWKTVAENIYLPFKLNKEKSVDKKEAEKIIKILEINDLMGKYPLQLSGGQRQRVALARAFILQPDLLLMDEPFSSLDSFTSANSQKLYLQLWKKYNLTTLLITHNVTEAVNLGEHILIMNKTSGGIVKQVENASFANENKVLRLQTTDEIMNVFNAIVE